MKKEQILMLRNENFFELYEQSLLVIAKNSKR